MEFTHLATNMHGTVTVVAVAKATLAAITEGNMPNLPTMPELLEEFDRAVAAAPAGVVIDIRDTNFFDHASVSALAALAGRLARRNVPRAIACSTEIKPLLRITKVDELCASFDNLPAAVEFAGREPELGNPFDRDHESPMKRSEREEPAPDPNVRFSPALCPGCNRAVVARYSQYRHAKRHPLFGPLLIAGVAVTLALIGLGFWGSGHIARFLLDGLGIVRRDILLAACVIFVSNIPVIVWLTRRWWRAIHRLPRAFTHECRTCRWTGPCRVVESRQLV